MSIQFVKITKNIEFPWPYSTRKEEGLANVKGDCSFVLCHLSSLLGSSGGSNGRCVREQYWGNHYTNQIFRDEGGLTIYTCFCYNFCFLSASNLFVNVLY